MTERKRGSKVVGHSREYFIRQMLRSSWSPERVALWLEQRHPDETLSSDTIRSYRTNFLTPDEVLAPSGYEEALKRIDVKVDALQELYNAVEIQKRRMAYLLNLETQSSIALRDTRLEMEVLVKMLLAILDKEMDLGVRERRPEVFEQRVVDVEAYLSRVFKMREELEKNR